MFDSVAKEYDDQFTNTQLGRMYRKQVHIYLGQSFSKNKALNILELNCGTGEDAIYLANQGHKIIACDVSSEMINVAKQKVSKKSLNDKVTFVECDIRNLHSSIRQKKYNFIFSNFGGLNCLSPQDLAKLSQEIVNLLEDNGRFIAVVMPKFCLWESIYFAAKFQFEKIFRRNSNKAVKVKVGTDYIETWYYSPSDFKHIFGHEFEILKSLPIGIALPPPYLNAFFEKKKSILRILLKLENVLKNLAGLSSISDHYLIDFIKRKS